MNIQFLKLDFDLITDKNINGNEFRIYVYLLSRYNKKFKGSFPSLQTISENLNMGIATVKRAIKHLVTIEYITIEKQKSKKGNFNIYKNFKYLIWDDSKRTTKNYYKPKTKNNFANFQQREYDYEKLEKQLLGWEE